MPPRDYDIFDLLIERQGERFRTRVLSSPAGEATLDDVEQTVSEQELGRFLSKVGHPRRASRGPRMSVAAETEGFGDKLFSFLFRGPIANCLERSHSAAIDKGRGLRIQIRLRDVPELCDLPWEFLHHDELGFFGLTTDTSIVRFLELKQPLAPLEVSPPLRILVVISSPSNAPPLDVEQEWSKLQEAVADLQAKGLVDLQRLDDPQLAKLNQRLRESPFHILHFVGHGFFDENLQAGQLYFQDPLGRAQPISAEQLGTALRDHKSIRLVVLNACEGARAALADPFAGIAQALIRRGVPAVIAMQFEVTDTAAVAFASEIYALIAFGNPIDACVAGARKAIYFMPNEVEWATPVLYLRSASSQLFTVEQTPSVIDQRVQHSFVEVQPSERNPPDRNERTSNPENRGEAFDPSRFREEPLRMSAEEGDDTGGAREPEANPRSEEHAHATEGRHKQIESVPGEVEQEQRVENLYKYRLATKSLEGGSIAGFTAKSAIWAAASLFLSVVLGAMSVSAKWTILVGISVTLFSISIVWIMVLFILYLVGLATHRSV
jgi:hypothetical protein